MMSVRHIGDASWRRLRGLAAASRGYLPFASTADGDSKPFDLLRWFSLLSLLCVVLLSATLATVLSRFMTNAMVERDAAISSQFVAGFTGAKEVWSYFGGLQEEDPGPELLAFFDTFFEHFLIESDVIRANVYAGDRTVIWSSTAALVGTHFGPNLELEQALKGEIAVEIGAVGRDDKAEHVEFEPELRGERYLECYIPIWSRDRKTVVGVVEIYRLTKDLFREIDEGKWLIWSTTIAGGTLLYLVLFGIVRRANAVMRQQEKRLVASESMAAIGEMTSAVAHGIRNPLASIRSSAELAMIQDLEGVHRAAGDIIANVDRLNSWIRSFLYQAHGDSNAAATADINALVRAGLAGFATDLQRQGVGLTLDMEEPLPLVRGDPVILGHAFNSLIANALEAMPQGGELHVETRQNQSNRTVEIRIVDSGEGLASDMAEQGFRPFTTTKDGGLGLGLSLSRRVIERFGGRLDLTGGRGKGSVATIWMRAAS
ncbi:MAG: sensor histidine kinase [Bradyrhizobium sp.]